MCVSAHARAATHERVSAPPAPPRSLNSIARDFPRDVLLAGGLAAVTAHVEMYHVTLQRVVFEMASNLVAGCRDRDSVGLALEGFGPIIAALGSHDAVVQEHACNCCARLVTYHTACAARRWEGSPDPSESLAGVVPPEERWHMASLLALAERGLVAHLCRLARVEPAAAGADAPTSIAHTVCSCLARVCLALPELAPGMIAAGVGDVLGARLAPGGGSGGGGDGGMHILMGGGGGGGGGAAADWDGGANEPAGAVAARGRAAEDESRSVDWALDTLLIVQALVPPVPFRDDELAVNHEILSDFDDSVPAEVPAEVPCAVPAAAAAAASDDVAAVAVAERPAVVIDHSAAAAAAAAAELAPVAEPTPAAERWACAVCTFANDAARGICDICGAGNPSSAAPAAPAPSLDGAWVCETCTFLNAAPAPRCEMCQVAAPASVRVVVQQAQPPGPQRLAGGGPGAGGRRAAVSRSAIFDSLRDASMKTLEQVYCVNPRALITFSDAVLPALLRVAAHAVDQRVRACALSTLASFLYFLPSRVLRRVFAVHDMEIIGVLSTSLASTRVSEVACAAKAAVILSRRLPVESAALCHRAGLVKRLLVANSASVPGPRAALQLKVVERCTEVLRATTSAAADAAGILMRLRAASEALLEVDSAAAAADGGAADTRAERVLGDLVSVLTEGPAPTSFELGESNVVPALLQFLCAKRGPALEQRAVLFMRVFFGPARDAAALRALVRSVQTVLSDAGAPAASASAAMGSPALVVDAMQVMRPFRFRVVWSRSEGADGASGLSIEPCDMTLDPLATLADVESVLTGIIGRAKELVKSTPPPGALGTRAAIAQAAAAAAGARRVSSRSRTPTTRVCQAYNSAYGCARDSCQFVHLRDVAVGARVVRNPAHWQWDAQDGGVGGQGVVEARTFWHEEGDGGGVQVRWDNGTTQNYRWGADGRFDVKLAGDGEPSGEPKAAADGASLVARRWGVSPEPRAPEPRALERSVSDMVRSERVASGDGDGSAAAPRGGAIGKAVVGMMRKLSLRRNTTEAPPPQSDEHGEAAAVPAPRLLVRRHREEASPGRPQSPLSSPTPLLSSPSPARSTPVGAGAHAAALLANGTGGGPPRLSGAAEAALTEIFSRHTADGTMSRVQFADYIVACGVKGSMACAERVQSIFAGVETNAAGAMTLKGFLQFYAEAAVTRSPAVISDLAVHGYSANLVLGSAGPSPVVSARGAGGGAGGGGGGGGDAPSVSAAPATHALTLDEIVVGASYDVLDSVNNWCDAVVVEKRASGEVQVHYDGWGSKWDEWVPVHYSRIMPHRTYSVPGMPKTGVASDTQLPPPWLFSRAPVATAPAAVAPPQLSAGAPGLVQASKRGGSLPYATYSYGGARPARQRTYECLLCQAAVVAEQRAAARASPFAAARMPALVSGPLRAPEFSEVAGLREHVPGVTDTPVSSVDSALIDAFTEGLRAAAGPPSGLVQRDCAVCTFHNEERSTVCEICASALPRLETSGAAGAQSAAAPALATAAPADRASIGGSDVELAVGLSMQSAAMLVENEIASEAGVAASAPAAASALAAAAAAAASANSAFFAAHERARAAVAIEAAERARAEATASRDMLLSLLGGQDSASAVARRGDDGRGRLWARDGPGVDPVSSGLASISRTELELARHYIEEHAGENPRAVCPLCADADGARLHSNIFEHMEKHVRRARGVEAARQGGVGGAYTVGDPVFCAAQDGLRMRAGIVRHLHSNGTYEVLFDDGSSRKLVPEVRTGARGRRVLPRGTPSRRRRSPLRMT